MTEKKTTNVVTCPGTFSYLNVWEPRFDDNKVDKEGNQIPIYSSMFLFDKKDKTFLKAFNAAVKMAFEKGVELRKFNSKAFASLKKPLRDGDEELKTGLKEDPIYKGKYFFNATTTKIRPDVKIAKDGAVVDIVDHAEFYSGCVGRMLINLYPYNTKGNRGIAVGINGFLKLQDGTRLDGRPDTQSAFEKFADEGESAADTEGSDFG